MKRRKIADSAKVRLVIDGTALQTTAGLLRYGGLSTTLYDAWKAFEAEHMNYGIMGRGAAHRDIFLNRDVQIQIDLY